jgi:hypothetical protein
VHSQQAYHGCEWILEHLAYKQWRYGTDSNILWLTADASRGKSAFARTVVDENLLHSYTQGIVYYFFSSKDGYDDVANTLCALLHQLFCTFDGLSRRYAKATIEEHGQALRDNVNVLWDILIRTTGDSSTGNIFCILDSLENLGDSKEAFLNRLVEWHSNSRDGKLKFLLTSRPRYDLARHFARSSKPVAVLQLGALNVSPLALSETGQDKMDLGFLHLGGTMMLGYSGQSENPVIAFSDGLKNVIERCLHQPIIWWPLADPVRTEKKGCSRIAWKCVRNNLLPSCPVRPLCRAANST